MSIELTYQTDADDCPSIANTAVVSATDDVDRTNNASDEVVVTVNCPDVTVDKQPVVAYLDGELPLLAGADRACRSVAASRSEPRSIRRRSPASPRP